MPGMRGYISRFCCLLPLALLMAGCSSPLRKFQDAEQMQKEGQYSAAIRKYAEVLTRLPDEQSQLASLVTLHIAECQWAIAEPKAAMLSLENSLAADPENLHPRERMAEFMLATGSPQLAIENAEWVLAREPENLDAFTVVGAAHAVLGQIALAQAAFQHVLARDPARAEAALTLAQIYAALGDEGKARSVLLQAAHASGANAAPWLALARLEEEAGNISAAEDSYRKAVAASNDRQAKLRLAEFLSRSSRIGEAEQVLSGVDGGASRYSTVRADFDLLLGRAAEAVTGYASFLADPASKQRDLAEARSHDQSTLTRAAVIVRLIEAELAAAYKQTEKDAPVARAKALLEQYRGELDESATESLQAEVAMVAGDLSQAELHSERAVELAPQSAAANFIAGLVKRAGRDLPAANVYWNTALEKDPEFLPARQAVAEQALSRGDAGAAEDYIVSVVRREPANFEALCIYARALAAQEKFAAAALIARRALAADGTSAAPHLILGNMAMQEKRWASAFVE